MFSFRDLIIFLAGAAFFHTVSHLFIYFYIKLPFKTNLIVLTQNMNNWAIVINGLITILLIWWAKRLD